MVSLSDKYAPEGPERVGFILKTGKVIEVENVSDTPETSFSVSLEDLKKHSGDAKATWHTHPGGTCNLSVADYNSFLQWPDLEHYIVGEDGVRKYWTEDGHLVSD